MVRQVFDEPKIARITPLEATEPTVNWFLESTRPDAVDGRRVINDLYSRFPDDGGHLRDSLRSSDDAHLMGALDELLVHDLLVSRYRVTYEEGEGKGTRPDFRLYDGGGAYVAAVEVATLFLREDWVAEQRRQAVVEDALNQRLILTTHSIQFEIRRWDDSPKLRDMARWVERTLDDLRADPGALPLDESGAPEKIYSTRAVEIAFRFQPLPTSYAVRNGDRIVLGGAAIGGLINSAARLRERLDDKAVKYDLRGKPFAIVVGVRDSTCDLGDVHQALTGTPAVVVATGEGVRKGDGFFGRGRDRAGGKHQRVSTVFSVHEWFPGGLYQPRIVRFDNPFAAAAFPLDALPINGHWGEVERKAEHILCDWLVPPVPPIHALPALPASAAPHALRSR